MATNEENEQEFFATTTGVAWSRGYKQTQPPWSLQDSVLLFPLLPPLSFFLSFFLLCLDMPLYVHVM